MSALPSIIQIPLSHLRLSPLNVRKGGTGDISGLAASIEAISLQQNLTVHPGNDDTYEVASGGRRLAALQLLRDRGAITPDFSVPCKVIERQGALEASTAENTLREAMHPADQFDAFRAMVDDNLPVADVAAHFGVTERVVKQRLKLSNVAPDLVNLYRVGSMSLDQLQSLALTDDHQQQRDAWFGFKEDWQRNTQNLRSAITKQEVRGDSPLAQFVTLEAYAAAGGVVRSDLFSSRDDTFLASRTLLQKLALEKLEKVAENERKNGWAWVETHLSMDYSKLAEYPVSGAEPKYEKPTAEDKGRMVAIQERRREITALIDADEEGEAEIEADEYHRLVEEDERLEAEHDRLSSGRQIWPEGALATCGVIVHFDAQRGVLLERGRLQPGQKVDKSGAVTGTATVAKQTKPAGLSADMTMRLELHRAAVLREYIAGDHLASLQLLITHLLCQLLSDTFSTRLLAIAPTNVHRSTGLAARSKFPDLEAAEARKAMDARIAQWKKRGLPQKAADLHAWVGALPLVDQLKLLALATALSLETNSGTAGKALADVFEVDMSAWWHPTAETYLTLVPKALLAEAVGEVSGKHAREAVLAMKKDEAIATTAKHLSGKAWLPKPLRGATYGEARKKAPIASPPAAKAATKKAGPAKAKAPTKLPAKSPKKATTNKPAVKKVPAAKKATAKKPAAKRKTS